MKKMKKFFFVIVILIMSMKLFSIDIPNEKVFTNPEREVKTVDAKKNREHAELNITVNKLTPKKISGTNNGGVLEIDFPEDEGILKDGERFIFSNELDEINPKVRKAPRVYSLKGKNLKTVKNELDEIFYVGKISGNGKDLLSVYEVSLRVPIPTLPDVYVTVDISKMRPGSIYEFEMLSGTKGVINSSSLSKFPGEKSFDAEMTVDSEILLNVQNDLVGNSLVTGINGTNTGALEELKLTSKPTGIWDVSQLKIELKRSYLFDPPIGNYQIDIMHKIDTSYRIQRIHLTTLNGPPKKRLGTINLEVDTKLINTGWINVRGKYVTTDEGDWKNSNLIDYVLTRGNVNLSHPREIEYIYRLNNGILERADAKNVDEGESSVKYPTGNNEFYYIKPTSSADTYLEGFTFRKKHNNQSLDYDIVLLHPSGEEIQARIDILGSSKDVEIGSGRLKMSTYESDTKVEIVDWLSELDDKKGEFLDIMGGLSHTSYTNLATHVSYRLGTGPYVTVPLVDNSPFMVSIGNYELSIGRRNIEVKKLEKLRAYNDKIEIIAQREIGGKNVDLGKYTLTLENRLPETTATINVSKMRADFGYEFDLTAATGNANISSSNTHNFLLEPEAPPANRTLAVGPEGILSAGTIDNVASVSVTGITVGKNDEVLEEISYDTTEKKLKLTKSMLFGAPNKSYVIEFKDATGFVIQKLNLVVENAVSKESATRSIQIDQRLLSTGWVDSTGRYVFANDGNWNNNKVTDANIATGSSSGGTTTNVRYIYRLNNGIIERADAADVETRGIVKYPAGNNPLYYSRTAGDFFVNFAVRKVTPGAAPVEYKLVLVSSTGEEIEAIVNLTGTAKGMTVGSGTLDTTTLLNNAITKINGGNPLLSNTAGSFVDAKGGLTS
ncbi:MAG: hypothetical protein ACRC4T_23225, partial [Cetobacterium sp.]|uniref:hypothetical protein n=1 Tax=Cetobacterium sp. TaxID=2071632 RepID=UPI003F3A33B8